MKNILRKSLYIILMVTMIITSFTPFSTKADDVYTGDHSQISNAGGTRQTDDGKVIISKNITKNDEENYFDIELTVKTKKIVSSITIPQDLAIVLVLDTSNSMSNKNMTAPDGTTKSRLNVLKDALRKAEGFIEQFASSAETATGTNPDVKRMLSVVSFNHKATTEHGWSTYQHGNYDSFVNDFKTTINNLNTGSGTAPAVGLMRARELLENSGAQNKYIIFLTDGYPTAPCGKSSNNYAYTSSTDCPYQTSYGSYHDLAATQANEQAVLNKNAGIKTYSIGVGVDGEATYTNESQGTPVRRNTLSPVAKQYVVGYEMRKVATTSITGNTTITLDDLNNLDLIISNTAKTNALYSNGNNRNDLNNNANLWTFTKNSDGTYYIKYKNSNNTSNYLSIDASGDGISLRNQSQATKFTITKNNDNYTLSTTVERERDTDNCIEWNREWVAGHWEGSGRNWKWVEGHYENTTCKTYEKEKYNVIRYIVYNNGWKASDTEGYVQLSQLNTETTYTSTGDRLTGPTQFKFWLGGNAKEDGVDTNRGISANVTRGTDSGYGIGYYDVSDGEGLQDAYDAIFDGIRQDMEELSQAWTVRDPMNYEEGASVAGFKVGEFAQFVNFYETSITGTGAKLVDENGSPIYVNHNTVGQGKNDNEVKFDPETNRIIWDLKNSDYVLDEYNRTTKETVFTYRLTYRVRLMNENGDSDHLFDGSTTYSTNGNAELDYVFVENGEITERGTIDFPNPVVIGKSNKFSFNKLSGYSNINLDGAVFRVYLDKTGKNTKKMLSEANHIDEDFDITTSAINGKVNFENIPSGYDYIMEEVTPPQGYAESMVGPFGPINDLETAKGYGYTEEIFNNKNDGSKKYYFTIIDGNITYTSVPSTIYNFPEYKKLVIRKEVKPNDENNQNAYIDNDKEFSFTITVDDSIANHYDAIKNNETISIKLKNKVGSFKLKNNEEIEIYIPYGVHYEIEESEHNGYTVTYDENKEGYIELTNEKVVVTNKKEPTNIKVKKVWENISGYASIPKVEVTLQRSLDNKNWEDAKDNKGNVLKATIDTSVKDYAEWNNLDGDYAYRVIETNIIGEDPEIFNVDYKFDENTGTWTITNTDTRIMVLPEAGSSGGLILASLAFVFITMPVMYTAYNLYIDKRWF